MSDRASEIDWRRGRRFAVFSAVIFAIALAVIFVYRSLLVPIAVAAFLTYLLLPFVDRLDKTKIPRTLAVCAIVITAVTVVVLGAVLVAPLLYDQALVLIRLIPVALNTIMQSWLPTIERYVSELGWMPQAELHEMLSVGSLLSRLQYQLQAGLAGLWRTGASLAGGMVNFVLLPILTFFMLKDFKAMSAGLSALVPRDLLEPASSVMARVNVTLRSVIKGQVTVAGILAVLYVIGLSFVGLQSAIAIGFVAGLCRIIPYLDVIVGGILSGIVIVTNFQGWGQALGVALVFLVVQAIDGAFITPRVIGERVGLHPIIVIVSVIAFADWFGFWGVLVAIPVVAIAKVLWTSAKPYYLASRAYKS